MYCTQCGIEISETSKFCSQCGSPVKENDISNNVSNKQNTYDAVQDLKAKLKEIESRKKPTIKKGKALTEVVNVVKKKAYDAGLPIKDTFEEQKLLDKKQLIIDYPMPDTPEQLERFAKYIASQSSSKNKQNDELTEIWKEKLNQVQRYSKKRFNNTEETKKIKNTLKI